MNRDNAAKGRPDPTAQPPGRIVEAALGRASVDRIGEVTRRNDGRFLATDSRYHAVETTTRGRRPTTGRGRATLVDRRDASIEPRAEVIAG